MIDAPSTSAERPLAVVVLAGGRSSEHEVSLASGASVSAGLRAAGHDVVEVEIGRDGRWRRGGEELVLAAGRGLLGADVAFPALHGPYGEDGAIQGMLETLDVAYVGSPVASSALCMDKVLFKDLMAAHGVAQVDHIGVRSERFAREPAAVRADAARLGMPVFVKPARLGSSVGIAKASSEAELDAALAGAFAHDELAIVEAMARGTEVECGVLSTRESARAEGEPAAIVSLPGEIVIEAEWYDYAAKYEPGGMHLEIPARISEQAAAAVRALALEAYALAGCEGLARADFFVDGATVLLNELNTMPGFTPTSVYAKLLDASGIPYPQLVDRLCRLALERRARERGQRH
ncbi:MAG TPA: D-alanine--D-alanine ligase family protein [Solirubrobacteraceae bacterium]|nr:D-alanine--D-alanine ligase family protein [Solirubrobacteraceae bacterium]